MPTNWSTTNKIEVIGGGAGGGGGSEASGGGGYSIVQNITSLTAGASVGYGVGDGGTAGTASNNNAGWGGSTWVCSAACNSNKASSTNAIIGVTGGANSDYPFTPGGNNARGGCGVGEVQVASTS